MSFVYTEESLIRDGYAGVPTTRISELVHGYQFDPLAPRSRGQPQEQLGAVAGQPSDIKPVVRTGKSVKARKTWDVAGVESEVQNAKALTGRTVKPRITGAQMKECLEWHSTKIIQPKATRRLRDYRRRKATKQEEVDRFSRAYVCTDSNTGRTEIMTARRPGAAYLDLDLNTFDVYASHAGRSLRAPIRSEKKMPNLDAGLHPQRDTLLRPGRLHITPPGMKVEQAGGFITSFPEPRPRQALGYLRRKIDNDWSRSNKSCFGLDEGYEPMHWNIRPEKPLINTYIGCDELMETDKKK